MDRTVLSKTHDKVVDHLIGLVHEKQIGRGDQLPPERTLSETLSVSRAAIRETYLILNILGIAENRRGSGTYFKDEVTAWSTEPTELVVKLSGITQREIFEYRRMIELETVTMAARRITDGEIRTLSACFEAMVHEKSDAVKQSLDREFHALIAQASKNQIIINAYSAMLPVMDGFVGHVHEAVLEQEGNDGVDKLHRDIFHALKSRDEMLAREAMRAHMMVICMRITQKPNCSL